MPTESVAVLDAHAQARAELACAFRWTARLGMHEAIANHFSLAVSEDGRRFLINPYGRHFSRVRASDLLLLDADDPSALDRPDAPDITAWALHGALHRRHRHARCILHVHSKYATALACLADSRLPPIEQNSMRFFERVAIDEGFDGMGLGDEAERVSRQLGDKPILLMGNHGVLVAAPSVAQAFDDLYYFERACEVYLTALATGRPLRIASDEVARKTAQQWLDYPDFAARHFTALQAILDEEEPDYRS
ncbi:class II aldolase and adducin N-terminal domain-containing protein [Pseudomonas sp. LA21]|uniref:class II aldolase and adducin N-terminal domain-containing protein n=1 Tax=unclassified Pseudomonas TaxID=196821 RepID=UPI001FB73937|nr:class II aldolase and adducin N-terminal domain-containing protein [Pseudomonas sp. LA21]MCJ1885081.1 class II aldolase and adducin N-terminal domain-containing protein [Pseudomonas sp. LA21]